MEVKTIVTVCLIGLLVALVADPHQQKQSAYLLSSCNNVNVTRQCCLE